VVLEKGGEDHLELSLRTEVVLLRVKEDRNMLLTVKMKANWTGRTLHRYRLLKCVIAGKIEERTEVRERHGVRHKELMDDLLEN
jgi:hypothetical protein